MRVLVVEDDFDTAEMLSVTFRMFGSEATAATRGIEALRIARELDPHLILLDIGLPDISGFEVVRQLRADSVTASRFIVAVSGWGHARDIALAAEAGFDAHYTKPIDLAKIRHIIQAAEARAL